MMSASSRSRCSSRAGYRAPGSRAAGTTGWRPIEIPVPGVCIASRIGTCDLEQGFQERGGDPAPAEGIRDPDVLDVPGVDVARHERVADEHVVAFRGTRRVRASWASRLRVEHRARPWRRIGLALDNLDEVEIVRSRRRRSTFTRVMLRRQGGARRAARSRRPVQTPEPGPREGTRWDVPVVVVRKRARRPLSAQRWRGTGWRHFRMRQCPRRDGW